MLKRQEKRYKRHARARVRISGTTERPRLCVFRSSKHIYAQLIDDQKRKTLVAANDLELESKGAKKKTGIKKLSTKTEGSKGEKRTGKLALAYEIGKLIAERALKKKIKKVVFDKAGYKYHGQVKALAEGAREGGLSF